jgi:hypothetical protein
LACITIAVMPDTTRKQKNWPNGVGGGGAVMVLLLLVVVLRFYKKK